MLETATMVSQSGPGFFKQQPGFRAHTFNSALSAPTAIAAIQRKLGLSPLSGNQPRCLDDRD